MTDGNSVRVVAAGDHFVLPSLITRAVEHEVERADVHEVRLGWPLEPFGPVAEVQEAGGGGQLATFGWGMDDVLTTVGPTVYLVRFEAQGAVKDPAQLSWDFGDGTTATGPSVTKRTVRSSTTCTSRMPWM